MGGRDPVGSAIKDTVNAGIDIVANPVREVGRAAGLQGVVDLIDGSKQFVEGVNTTLVDKATGEEKRLKRDAEQIRDENSRRAGVAAASARAAAEKEAFNASEKERMAVGSGARTLLTGPSGLEDSDKEDYSIARRTLRGS